MNQKRKQKEKEIRAIEEKKMKHQMMLASKKMETHITDNSKYLFKSDGTVTNMHADFVLS